MGEAKRRQEAKTKSKNGGVSAVLGRSNVKEAPSGFLESYNELVNPETILEAAMRLGVIERQRKIDIPGLVEATIQALSPIPGTQTTIFTNYLALSNESVVPSSFYDRFNDPFAELMKELAERAVAAVRSTEQALGDAAEIERVMTHFTDLRIADSTCKMLQRLAAAWAPSTSKKRPAGMKLHAVVSFGTGLPIAGELTAQKTHDNKGYPSDTLETGTLSLFDLGYIDVERFIDATERDAYFLTRLKSTHQPEIVRVFQGGGSRRAARGLPVQQAVADGILQPVKGIIDVDVLLQKGDKRATVRVVGVIDPDNDIHWYLTNVPRSVFDPQDIAEAYRIRWFVELLFKQLKSGTGMNAIRAWRPAALAALIYGKIVALCLARLLEIATAKRHGAEGLTQLALVLSLARAVPLLMTAA